MKGFCMAKSAVDLDVNIVLSKYGFNGVAPFYTAHQTQYFEENQHFQSKYSYKAANFKCDL